MGLVSPSQSNPGDEITAASINNPVNQLATVVNSIENSNISATAGISPSKIAGGSAAMLSAWASWTPTWTNLTVSSSTVTAKYIQVGKTVHFRLTVVLGGGNAPTGSVTFTLPVTATAYVGVATTQPIAWGGYNDSSSVVYQALASFASTTTGILLAVPANGVYAQHAAISATAPFTFGNGDEIFIQGFYEAA